MSGLYFVMILRWMTGSVQGANVRRDCSSGQSACQRVDQYNSVRDVHAHNPKKDSSTGSRNSIFVPMTGAPYLRDLDDVRRAPTLDDLATFHKLAHMLPGDAFISTSYC